MHSKQLTRLVALVALPSMLLVMNALCYHLRLGPTFTASPSNSGEGPAHRCSRHGHASRRVERSPDTGNSGGRYPSLNLDAVHGSVQLLHQEPPVWLIKNFLTAEDCNALIEEGRKGLRPEKVYEGSFVVFDEERLKPLVVAAPLCALVSWAFHGDVLAATTAFALAGAAVFGLKEFIRWYSETVAAAGGKGGARFTGTKWQLGPSIPGGPAEGARERLLERVCRLCGIPGIQWMEPPCITRYKLGESQAAHLDSRERPEPGSDKAEVAAFERIGGQRIVQCLCYLNDVDIDTNGGATSFLHEALAGLRVQPVAGSALVFCTAFADGEEDVRMVHCAEPLHGSKEVEKWIVPVWSLEQRHQDWHQWEQHPENRCQTPLVKA